LFETALQRVAGPVDDTAERMAVSVAGMTKTFRGAPYEHSTLRERLTRPWATYTHEPLRALRHVTFLVALIVLPLVAGGWAFARAAPRVAELV
jgi:hypothetical protein